MPISRLGRLGTFASACWVLAACGAASDKMLAPRSVSLSEDFVVIGAPGYCADVTRTNLTHDPQVILFGSCAALRDNAFVPAPEHPGLVTVAVTDLSETVPSVTALETFMLSDRGQSHLARDGDAASVIILQTRREDGILFLHARDISEDRTPGALPDVWRAMMTVDGKLLSLSLLSFSEAPLSSDIAFEVLRSQCDRIRAANLS